MIRTLTLVLAVLGTAAGARGAEPQRDRDDDALRTAVERGLVIVQAAARNYPTHRQCYSCHHQTLPMLAMTAARDAGFEIDDSLLRSQTEFTRKSFENRIESLREGTGIGGRAMTVGYGLWTLEIADEPTDELGEAMVTFLLKTQEPAGSWRPPSHRPPLEESLVSCTVLAAYGMQLYAGEPQQEKADAAIEKAKEFLAGAELASQEDRAARLWGLHLFDGSDDEVAAARAAVLETQRDDGGWGQIPEMESDAYATGLTLWVLRETGLTATAPEFGRGVEFLLQTQGDDGSWHVETRSKPVQIFFDNGDPHGKDQFISVAATAWAVAALCAALR